MTRPAPAHLSLYQLCPWDFVTSPTLQRQKASLGQAAAELGLRPALRDSDSQALNPPVTPRVPPLPTAFQPGCVSRMSEIWGFSQIHRPLVLDSPPCEFLPGFLKVQTSLN